MSARFDDLCRVLATPMSRRRVLQLVVGGLVGGFAGLRPREAWGAYMCLGSNITCDKESECCYGPDDTAFCCNKVNPNTPYCCSGFAFTGLCCTSINTCCTVAGPPVVNYCCDADPKNPHCCNDSNMMCCANEAECCTVFPNKVNACCVAPRVCCAITNAQGNTSHLCCPTSCKQVCILPDTHDYECCPGNQECCIINQMEDCCPAAAPFCCPGNPNKCCPGKCSTLGGCCPTPSHDPQSAYYFEFGGTFVTSTGEKSTPGCQVCGLSENADADSVTAATFMGLLEDYDFASRTVIGPVTFDALQGEVFDDGDVNVMAMGSGSVNGLPTNIVLMASETAGVITYGLFNADTMQELSGGTGEPGTSSLELTITTP
jgi:hypothetical protein